MAHLSVVPSPPRVGGPNVIPFPRGSRLLSDLDRAALLRRVRFAAMAAGLGGGGKIAVEQRAEALIDKGMPACRVFAACKAYAEKLARGRDDLPPVTA